MTPSAFATLLRGFGLTAAIATQLSAGLAATSDLTTVHIAATFYWSKKSPGAGQTSAIPRQTCELLKQQGFFGHPAHTGEKVDVGNFRCTWVDTEIQPKHGSLHKEHDGVFKYVPQTRFVGRERMTFLIDAEGKQVRAEWDVYVNDDEPNKETEDNPNP
ncbi:MAG TPA: hypothetical protein VE029_05385 [Rhizobacter sp.]|nr:hypothetical protein [Rhizobacter sp.]